MILLLLLLLLIVVPIAVIIVILFCFMKVKSRHKSSKNASTSAQKSTAAHDDDKHKPVTMTGFGTILSDDNGLAETEEENREMPSTTRKKQNSLKTQKKKNKFRKSKYKPGEVPTTEKGNEEIVLAKSKTTSDFPNKRGTQSIGVGSGFESGASIPYQEGDSQEPLMPYDSSEVPRYT
jgi:FtsZ-interacting cell division protein ZipA